MFKTFLAVIVFCSLVSFVFAGIAWAQQTPRPPVNWQPIIGPKVPGVKFFIDTNSLKTYQEKNEKYNSGEILVSYDSNVEVSVGSKKYMVKSLVKSLVIECDTGLMVPVLGLYFSQPKPLRTSKPITGIEYSKDISKTVVILKKNTSLYHALCPVYI